MLSHFYFFWATIYKKIHKRYSAVNAAVLGSSLFNVGIFLFQKLLCGLKLFNAWVTVNTLGRKHVLKRG